MAETRWGKVYLYNKFAGLLQEEPGGRFAFTYDSIYLASGATPVSYTLPLQEASHYCERGLHPYFDNLVAEGWLRNIQARAIEVHPNDIFALLLTFGQDCIGAVTVIDPDPKPMKDFEFEEPESLAALASRASFSGIQAKIAVIKTKTGYEPATPGKWSTHIAKLPSSQMGDLLENELLALKASQVLLPKDKIVEAEIAPIGEKIPKALIIKRFDRSDTGEKYHFEEINQLLGQLSVDKYNGSYEEIGRFILNTPLCMPAEAERLFRRILVCILLGNTDAHLKNFAMFHTPEGLRLTPAYDILAAALYPQYDRLALSIDRAKDLEIVKVQAKHLIALGEAYQLPAEAIMLAVEEIGKRIDPTKDAISKISGIGNLLKDKSIAFMEKRWNGTFKLIGSQLLKKRSNGAKRKDFLKNV